VNIQVQSQMFYGDEASLKDFFFVHRLVHLRVDQVINTAGGGSMPNATLDNDNALSTWVKQMRKEPLAEEEDRSLFDWLQLHANLHQFEYQALGLGTAPDFGVVDFSSQQQFDDWMFEHSAIHDTLNAATGQS